MKKKHHWRTNSGGPPIYHDGHKCICYNHVLKTLINNALVVSCVEYNNNTTQVTDTAVDCCARPCFDVCSRIIL